jgi:predicted amidohydrolase YtcJ
MKNLFSFLLAFLFISCTNDQEPVDLLITNANIYTVNDSFEIAEAFVVKDGRIIEVGTSKLLQKKYKPNERLNAEGRTILPGFIDAHAHLYNLGVSLQQVDLVGTTSYKDVLDRVLTFQKGKSSDIILGRGWDQNDWEVKEFPTKSILDSIYPNSPIALKRIDGHAYWVNSKALELAGITSETKMKGGEVVLLNGQPSGILIDSPMDLIDDIISKPSEQYNITALKLAEKRCFELGLTTINDAGNSIGIDRELIELIDELQREGELKIRVYAMVGDSPKNLDYFLNKGIIKTDRLNVRSIKVYADGALGSRGAAMRQEYSDRPGQFGAMITNESELGILAERIATAGYQMNTHAIGDSANISVLRVYKETLKDIADPRWKVEHAQIITTSDFEYFSEKILPSVQPTHATSDMYWAEDRVGPDRIKGAYSYKTLLNRSGIIALGTDFPVEKVNPMHTFYAAVARKDLQNYPEEGFRKKEALTREETLRGMTIWAAYSNFEEAEKGSIEAGKFADFIILDTDIMTCEEKDIPKIKVLATYINGEKVFQSSKE